MKINIAQQDDDSAAAAAAAECDMMFIYLI